MKKSQEFIRSENCVLGVLFRLDGFLMNPLIQGYSGTAPETSRNAYVTNQRTTEDDSQSDPQPETGIFQTQTTRNSDPEESRVMVRKVNGKLHTVLPVQRQGSSRKTVLPVYRNSTVKTPLRQSK